MITWIGKRPLRNVIAYPAQLVETFTINSGNKLINPDVNWSDWPQGFPKSGLLFHGDNKDVLAHLLANGFRGKVKLIYIDPPFDSGADYVRQVTLRDSKRTPVEGTGYTLGEQIQYADIWANDNYLQFMFDRLSLLKELLSDEGSIFVHLDHRRVAHIRLIMDEVFGEDAFRNEIIWNYRKWGRSDNAFLKNHDTLLFYAKSNNSTFNRQYVPLSESTLRRFGGKFQIWADENRTRKITSDEESQGAFMSDVWEVSYIPGASPEKTGFPTQKPEGLISRVIKSASNPSDIVLDCFLGSGTTAAVSQKMGRRWIGCDVNKGAIQVTVNRLQSIAQGQKDTIADQEIRLPIEGLAEEEKPEELAPSQLSFAVYRVNDYDLQIQHNEAFNLAVEHLGITRTKTDSFFDGTLGKRLVKIIPFNHPLTPLDLEEIKNELSNRPEESRDIAVVCLGKELAVDGWLEDWNRLRRQGDFPNKIDVIELRTDPKVGGFFVHEPDQAMVKFERQDGNVVVTVENFLSPTIIQRLEQQSAGPLMKPQITDWRSMVDSIMIDANYDGQVFNITLSDVPEKKSDLVKGKYTLAVSNGAVVAVKITDMLGEEVLVTQLV